MCVVQVLSYVVESSVRSTKGIEGVSNCTAFYSPCDYSDLPLGLTPSCELSLRGSDWVLDFPVASDPRELSLLLLK